MEKIFAIVRAQKAIFIVFAILFLVMILLVVKSTEVAIVLAFLVVSLFLYLLLYNKYVVLSQMMQEKENELKIYQNLVRESNYCLHLNEDLKVNYLNKRVFRFLPSKEMKILGKRVFEIFDLPQKERLYSLLKTKGKYQAQISYQKEYREVPLTIEIKRAPVLSDSSYFVILKDSEEIQKTTSEIREEVLRDSLTSLPTRLKLLDDLQSFAKNSIFNKSTLMYVSIDNFDELNEFFGMDAGSIILMRTAEWLKEDLPSPNAKLYKIDFNHFAIMVPHYMRQEELERYLRRLTTGLSKEQFTFEGSMLNIDITVGVAKGNSLELVKNAYLALKEAEKLKRSYKVYHKNSRHEERFLRNIKINKMIKEAIEEGRVEPFFQAIYNLHTNEIEKYESLMRIKQQDNTYLRPGEFLDIAKRSKMYTDLSKEMIKKCFEQIQKVKHPISINISAEDMLDQRVVNLILRNLRKHNLGEYITFEIVENEQITGDVKIRNFIKKLKSYGCKIAIDDFGTGFSNFVQLQELNVDYIKIDGSLIKDITKNRQNEIMTRSIISMAKELNIQTVAEFVSTKAIFEKVKALGIDYAQGHFIDRADVVLLKNS